MISLNVDPLPVRGTGGVVVVIDTLRMSTTATVLGARGAGTLWILSDVAQARLLAKAHEALLLGERNEQPLPGFDGGNSPLEYLSADLQGRSAILCTTNGSRAVEAAADAQHVLLGTIVNARAVATRALALAQTTVTLSCAGTRGEVSLDDLLGAACIADELLQLMPMIRLSDMAKVVLRLLCSVPTLEDGLLESSHGQTLRAGGFLEDVYFAARKNHLACVLESQNKTFTPATPGDLTEFPFRQSI